MKIKITLVLLTLLALTMPGPNPASAETIQWLTYDEARKKNPEQSTKYLFYFQSDRCGYCRKLERETLAQTQIATYISENFIPVRIDTDKSSALAARHGVRGVPDIHFLSPEGEKIANWPGFLAADQLLPLLEFIHSDSFQKMSYQDFLRQR
jgi:thioredoxin-related protein